MMEIFTFLFVYSCILSIFIPNWFNLIANCGGVISGSSISGTITSPEWGSSATYPSFQKCTWIIYCDGEIVLNVKNFELESHSTCR